MEKQPTPINQGKREAMCLQPKPFHQCLWPERKLTEWGGLLGGAQNRSGWLQVLLAWHVMTLVEPFRNQSVMHETVHVSLKSYYNSTKQNTVGFHLHACIFTYSLSLSLLLNLCSSYIIMSQFLKFSVPYDFYFFR